jgi:hypothetical protein
MSAIAHGVILVVGTGVEGVVGDAFDVAVGVVVGVDGLARRVGLVGEPSVLVVGVGVQTAREVGVASGATKGVFLVNQGAAHGIGGGESACDLLFI